MASLNGSSVIAALAVLTFLGTASAQPAPARAPVEDPTVAAKTLFADGLQAYNVGEFDLAIAKWKQGYKIKAVPDFLFNIGQAYRGKRDYRQAVFFFNAFLREKPDAPNAGELRALRMELEKMIAEEQASRDRPPTNPMVERAAGVAPAVESGPKGGAEPTGGEGGGPATIVAPVDSGTQSDAAAGLRLTGFVAGVTGSVLLATGVVFTMSASSAQSDLEDASARGEPWSGELASREKAGGRNATLGVVLISAGAAALAGGAVAYYLGLTGEDSPTVTMIPTRTGGSIGFGVSF